MVKCTVCGIIVIRHLMETKPIGAGIEYLARMAARNCLWNTQSSDQVEIVHDQFLGAAGDVMTTKKTTLDDMLDEVFIKIISGQESLDAFDTVVEEWKAAGGQDMTDEVNAWYEENK